MDPTRKEPPPARPSHLIEEDGRERARMVDVSGKEITDRTAVARARLVFPGDILSAILAGEGPKGPIEEVARTAGVLAAKRTGELIPLCHPLGLDHVDVAFRVVGEAPQERLEVVCSARTRGRTGVEMEAMVGAGIAALTIYDMTKGLDKGIRIEAVELLEKTGGRSGTWRASD